MFVVKCRIYNETIERKTVMRKRKEFHPLNVGIETSVYDQLSAFCTKTGFSKTAVVENALRAYIPRMESAIKNADGKRGE